jgi:hypothetical protein
VLPHGHRGEQEADPLDCLLRPSGPAAARTKSRNCGAKDPPKAEIVPPISAFSAFDRLWGIFFYFGGESKVWMEGQHTKELFAKRSHLDFWVNSRTRRRLRMERVNLDDAKRSHF